ncbi:MAG: Serine-tRNA ligase [Parcubacteria group bacterium GW2011_GWA1_44_13]|uniref:Serine--tRNA ligase n=1 Tax=Candidatus Nomurabacteria bacterium GW2011_GWB1_44_12 TaxID=1618748 RepID=A0A837ICP6_9BACT|nr:MAG: Serine-tRNA ligase [Candidatus Nomurabacteria bacterium GW2011_GWB1_44_12]KKT38296.1 MAG: Serine-tRNA ligase [Parcubacteria group bacterium GW2011_GWA1_44_13]KKT59657.1 MAG: Serine-tRNA ligase [Parcubacteria group bacterium GW2011_GWC1_44_26]HBB44216.1 serine--tRNA ligase [Candidatus Yonathbacteria bacterium]
MLDIKFIRENAELVKEAAQKKNIAFDVQELLSADDNRKAILAEVEAMRGKQNEIADSVPRAENVEAREKLIAESKSLKDILQAKELELTAAMHVWQALMVQVPNLPDVSVPEGKEDSDNVEVRTWGTIPKFSFTPKDHIELFEKHDMADFERGTKVAGFRGYVLKGDGARLVFALSQFVLNELSKENFIPMMVPSLVRRAPLVGTGFLPQGEEDLYKTQDGDFLAGTAEVGTMGYHMDEVLSLSDLPKKYLSFSTSFRREAGSHSKDTKGLIRVHEFFKWEQVILCEASHEESVKFHEYLTENSEKLMQKLGIPYHVVLNCGGDLGLGQVKKYDIEAWVPSQNTYRETHSASYFHDFQTRRLNIRYKDNEGKLRFAHSLNNTAIAMPRILVPLVENYQNADGSITIPEVLRPYMGGKEKIG